MPRIILTAEVADIDHWKAQFKTHGDVFRALGTTLIHYGTNDNNEVALYQEVDDLEKYFELMQSPETLAAMAHDGVKGETVRVFVLDEEWNA